MAIVRNYGGTLMVVGAVRWLSAHCNLRCGAVLSAPCCRHPCPLRGTFPGDYTENIHPYLCISFPRYLYVLLF